MKRCIPLTLSNDERMALLGLICAENTSLHVRNRAAILLLLDCQRLSVREVAEKAACAVSTVLRTQRSFILGGVQAALSPKHRPSTPRKLSPSVEPALVALMQSAPPEGCRRWNLQLLAGTLRASNVVESISITAVHRRVKQQGLVLRDRSPAYRSPRG